MPVKDFMGMQLYFRLKYPQSGILEPHPVLQQVQFPSTGAIQPEYHITPQICFESKLGL